MSLNNRIYFREHQSPGNGNSASLSVFKRIRATAVTSPRSAVPEPQPQASKGDTFPLYSVSRPGNQDNSKGDDTGTDWSLVCAISCHKCYQIPTFLNGLVSLQPHPRKCHMLPEDLEWTVGMPPHPYAHPYGRKDEMHGL